MGNAKSLRGGTLLMTQLKGADGQVYAIAQGNVLVGGVGASSGGSKVTVNHLSAGRIPVAQASSAACRPPSARAGCVYYELSEQRFWYGSEVVDAINSNMGAGTAQAMDGRRIAVKAPEDADARVSFLGKIDNLDVQPVAGMAKVVVNPRTGSVVMNQKVTLDACAVAHGSLSVVVDAGQPQGQGADIQVKQDNGSLMTVKGGGKSGRCGQGAECPWGESRLICWQFSRR
jgi:flagellar P-ring protein precursor FlgI